MRGAGFLAGCVMECNLAHCRSVAVLCMLFKIKSNPMYPLSGALPLPFAGLCFLWWFWLLIGPHLHLLAVGLLSTVELLCPSPCHSGKILVTLYLMVWDWWIVRAEPMLSCYPNLLFLPPTIFSFSSFHGLCGVGVFGLLVFSHSPDRALLTLF